MKRRLLTPGWVLLHLVFLAAFAASLWLGWWQWESAQEAGGSFRNLGYALQWPLFGAFALFLWYQVARMDLQRAAEEQPDIPVSEDGTTALPDPEADSADPSEEPSRSRKRSPVPPPAPPVDADEDPELAAYNRYLRELNEAERQRC
ncbi:hypothetical protein [Haloactinomyces albus]|uniref:DNA-binding transcriptional regulator of glucitol operon n=1 Tax=Haloactinomyces albus TaxID=1352928 RepID=A0AAE4CKW6_9ACTN|nr:hypothetical protein [Haloactinomyces albus]MDR7301179.1 DNA-binding transcriptional regulator of glucitol operon [Haloactinomyces albus]